MRKLESFSQVSYDDIYDLDVREPIYTRLLPREHITYDDYNDPEVTTELYSIH